MAFYSDVRRGENFKPSALMFNDIARSLNKIDGFRSSGISKVDDGATRISVCNETTVTLVARSAVQLYPAKSGINISRPDLSPPYGVSVYDSTSAWNWCILEETLNPGEIGSAILFGVTEVVLSIPNSDTDKIPANGFVIPNADDPEVFDIVSYPTQAKLLRVNKDESDRFIAEIAFIPFKTERAEYNGFFKLSLVTDEDGATRVKIYNGVVDFVADESPLSYARINAGRFGVAPFVSESTFAPSTVNEVLAYFYLFYDYEKASVEIKQQTHYGADASVSILLGKVCSVNGGLRVIQDSYGTPFLPVFYDCDWSV